MEACPVGLSSRSVTVLSAHSELMAADGQSVKAVPHGPLEGNFIC